MIFEGLGGDPADAWNAILECVKTDVLAKELFEYYQELLTEVGETPNLWTIPKITDSYSIYMIELASNWVIIRSLRQATARVFQLPQSLLLEFRTFLRCGANAIVVTGKGDNLAELATLGDEAGLLHFFLPMRHPVHNEELLSPFLEEIKEDIECDSAICFHILVPSSNSVDRVFLREKTAMLDCGGENLHM
ncbi:hypothetical protein AURANDRAFT_67721 [Aureococcus anophagefferens]|uniref:Uncharacterized protein n=1 Tax=Aureococcus anophagefferens TaxID=44056 RepID=F0YM60_AURAN|nr:hypothetical protein AURANDRAFT_67721 [Aureococcus anophagefferens]EGB03823.1 hypothetical protein AURANDRAFT_67721 [Aureococcus anophagefferens]|eukprot:XP_009041481.1 hypothetical protein AURANDRAFT_67721 [Aureococcus anophagefferens]